MCKGSGCESYSTVCGFSWFWSFSTSRHISACLARFCWQKLLCSMSIFGAQNTWPGTRAVDFQKKRFFALQEAGSRDSPPHTTPPHHHPTTALPHPAALAHAGSWPGALAEQPARLGLPSLPMRGTHTATTTTSPPPSTFPAATESPPPPIPHTPNLRPIPHPFSHNPPSPPDHHDTFQGPSRRHGGGSRGKNLLQDQLPK